MLANAKKFSKKKKIRLNFKKKNNSFFKPFAITSEVKPCTQVSIRITSNNVFLTIFNLEKKKITISNLCRKNKFTFFKKIRKRCCT